MTNLRKVLPRLVKRLEALNAEIETLNDEKHNVYDLGREEGIDAKCLRTVILRRKKDPELTKVNEELIELYMDVLREKHV